MRPPALGGIGVGYLRGCVDIGLDKSWPALSRRVGARSAGNERHRGYPRPKDAAGLFIRGIRKRRGRFNVRMKIRTGIVVSDRWSSCGDMI